MIEKKSNKKILYCIHIDWNWIKQRPHFIAENLNCFFQVDVLCKKVWVKEKNHNRTDLNLIFPFRLPLERLKAIEWINLCIRHLYLSLIYRHYDYFWFTAPTEDCTFLLTKIDRGNKVIYDCMDDILEFPDNADRITELFSREKSLYERADIVFCSSCYLKEKMIKRYGPKNIIVVNNALAMKNSEVETSKIPLPVENFINNRKKKIVYVGTISEWLDINLCKKILSWIPDVEIFLWGPYEKKIQELFQFEGINFCGIVDHDYVNLLMENSDILIMPFVINELILSVNPVKLYEYVKSGKPCIAPRYTESEPFGDYVYLYDDYNNCLDIISSILSGKISAKQNKKECIRFAEQNTWEKRVELIKEELEKLNK